ncbi:MAG TPA: DUF2330 domain-containing protein [Gemmataceae bacterium]|jgi:hypothetical protein|nr:DUF2330 domain-containing protein [Gemmataceae bacterium]
MSIRLLGPAAFAAVGLTALLAIAPPETFGCAIAPHLGQPVSIVEEDAIIVWDAVKKVEHFIRRASFRTESKDFGFLVPTPTAPTLSEVDDDVFDPLGRMIAPKVREVFGGVLFVPVFACTETKKNEMKVEAKSAVTVLSEAKVGGYTAAVLAADNAEALNEWLVKNGYPGSAELYGWLDPYLVQKWTITAFKIDADASKNQGNVRSKAVKMSFSAERPFFPYREPAAKDPEKASPGGRVLRIFLLSSERMSGTLGNIPWHAKTVWADRFAVTGFAESLKIPATDFPVSPWLTAFEDTASPRPGSAEVFFDPSFDRNIVHPPDIVHYAPPVVVPVELAFLAAIVIAFVGWAAWRQMRRAKANEPDRASS